MNKACHDEPTINSDSAGPGNAPTATGPHRRHAVSRRSMTACLVGLTLTETRGLSAQERPIKVGVSAGFTGPIAETVNGYAAGLLLPIKKINGEKGVLGRRVEIVQLDDKYQADLAVSNTQTFLEQGVEVLLGYVGTGPTEKTQAFLESRELMLFGPFAGATHLRTTNSANTIFVTGDYRSEIDRLIRHYTSIGSSRFVIFYQNDSFGKPLAEYALAGLAAKGHPHVKSVPIEPGSVATDQQLERAAGVSPHAVLMFTVAGPTISMVKKLRKTYSGSVGILSFLSNRGVITALGKDAAGVVISQVVPGPYDLSHPLVKEIYDLHPGIDRGEVTQAFITGYLTGRLFLDTLKASGGKPTPKQLKTAWNGLKNTKPFGLSFNEKGALYTDIAMLRSDGRFIR